jgi:hypothetical protein
MKTGFSLKLIPDHLIQWTVPRSSYHPVCAAVASAWGLSDPTSVLLIFATDLSPAPVDSPLAGLWVSVDVKSDGDLPERPSCPISKHRIVLYPVRGHIQSTVYAHCSHRLAKSSPDRWMPQK